MAVKVSGIITPSSGSYIAQAENIAFTENGTAVTLQLKLAAIIQQVADLADAAVTGTADDIIYEGSTTIKQKIADLETNLGTTADRISYTYTDGGNEVTTNVKAVLDDLREALDNIDDLPAIEQRLAQYASRAETASGAAQTSLETIRSEEELNNFFQGKNQAASLNQATIGKINALEAIAQDLQATFSYDAEFRLISREAYNQLELNGDVSSSTVYLIYDDTTSQASVTYYSVLVTTETGNTLQGTPIGTGSYAANSEITIAAVPKTGYQFDHWLIDGSDVVSENPTQLTVNAARSAIAYFQPISSTP